MKINTLTLFILTLALLVSAENKSNAQSIYEKKLSYAAPITSLKELFTQIEKETGLVVFYPAEKVAQTGKLNLNVQKLTVSEALAHGLKNTGLTYQQQDKLIIVSAKSRETTQGNDIAFSQRIITGTVTDERGKPLPGVNIRLKTGSHSATSDKNGFFSIRADDEDTSLIFSFIGYVRQEIPLGDQQTIHVVLKENTFELDEVELVSTGYQEIAKERATGSFQKINEQTLNTKISQDIASKIEGEISGIVFNTGGESMTIRGTSTINANKAPLIVVDGFPITQDINSINPSNVESITVLKDAAAASIWGIRAANGVIVITTKAGKKNSRPVIEFSTNFNIKPKQNYDHLPYASTESFLEFEKIRAGNISWGVQLPTGISKPPMGKALETYLLLNNGDLTEAEAESITDGLKRIDSREEFDRLFRRNEYWQQYNLAVKGGGERNTYRTSITYNRNRNQGSYVGNKRDELIGTLNNTVDITPKLKFSNNVNFNMIASKNNGMSLSDLTVLPQHQRILDENGNYITQPATFTQSYKDELVAAGYPYDWNYNLKQEFDNKNNKNNQTLLRLQSALEYKLTDYLSASGMYQYEWGQYNGSNLYNENTYTVRNTVNRYTVIDANGNLSSSIPQGHILSKNNNTTKSHSARFQLNFDQSFNEGLHQVTAIGGYEVRQELSEGHNFTHYGYDPQTLQYVNAPFGQILPVVPVGTSVFSNPAAYSEVENRFISYYGNAAYTYNNKYTLSLSSRLDDANLFGGDSKYRNIPLYSVGAKWDMYKEDFLKNNADLSQLALRVTRGSNGNVHTGTSPYVQASTSQNPYTSVPYAYISNVKNPSLRLEKTFVTNVGLDFGFFNDRLGGSIEYYNRNSQDLLAPVTFNSTLGFTNALVNSGRMKNSGWDIGLNALIVNNKNFKYNTSLNFSRNTNKLIEVEHAQETPAFYMSGLNPIKGNPLNHLYSYRFAGLDSDGYPQIYNENDEIINTYGQKLQNGNWVASTIEDIQALEYHGSTVPKYYGGWVNNFSYKGFSLRVLITYKLGYVFRNTNILNYTDMVSSYSVAHIHRDFNQRWKQPGDENTTIIPREPENMNTAYIGYYYYALGNQYVDNASHIRFKEIILGYNVHPNIAHRFGLNNLHMAIQANNLGVITFNKWRIDPESMVLPMQSAITFNLTASF
ncbi:SusC/RagA family TonB-linked outer membrane protein [Olivibacter sp. XZL3]|uniref:SusC/RagA family TonB-linked outer membrane protein n=1 Tax=Olivibacter sp. XZL3 TaxID=1735116 RepID=UPI001416FF65|nr:SusC/RagA family TonB-linked outer membrane protein [Olivibacter sp. XZL3]